MNVQNIVRTVQKELVDVESDKRLKLNPKDPLNAKLEEFEDTSDIILISDDEFDERKRKSNSKEQTLFQNFYTKYKKESLPKFPRSESRIETDGIDALAWYQPFHYPDKYGRWGIFLLEDGIWTVAKEIKELRNDGYTIDDLLISGARILFWHEYFHFLNEIAISTIEISSNFAKKNYQILQDRKFNLSNYSHLNYYELEEALANSFCLKKSGSIFKTILKNFMDHQPNGYRDYNSVKWQKQLRVGCSVLGACASDDPRNNSLNNQNQPISPYESFYHVDLKHVKIDDVPVYLVHNVPIENRINLFVPKPPNEWLRHENFRKEFRKLAKSYGGRLLKWFDKSIELAASPDKSEQNKVVNKKIQGNDHLWEFRLNEGIRAFYKVCNNDRILLVGIKKHPPLSGAGYQKLYRKNPDYCEETTKISK
tara:strand:- start:12769 stop:14040 length:1272 start_codon:yes stop_codon:yes gene_type:complete